jgi:hypothetical protein
MTRDWYKTTAPHPYSTDFPRSTTAKAGKNQKVAQKANVSNLRLWQPASRQGIRPPPRAYPVLDT